MNYSQTSLVLPAPAKLNLFLHITGKRNDGYHNLETLFQFIDIEDTLSFESVAGHEVELIDTQSAINVQDNLVFRAAQRLINQCQQHQVSYFGVRITLEKRLPQGAGLGGGSSDAATTLVGLNYLWGQPFTKQQLLSIGAELGADVPIFIHGHSAFATGIGDQFTDVEPDQSYYLVVKPQVNISTAALFADAGLKRDCKPLSPSQWDWQNTNNVFESVVLKQYPAVAKLHAQLLNYGPTRLTGTGACLFTRFANQQQAIAAQAQLSLPESYVVRGQNRSSLIRTLTQI
ncbi:4-(cytidine 5'-diphospho)-2-C-methyl-D-erythritol kinase [Idiomarina baltica]|jgi:4-diphosphocytidyl-2-C-methyl-D-erythritol kinase|uniref:4-(cytidine 5'-diphospho)-2-C-methyl-D-erythritol kinase n=1 Tax=Idiomarina baltica TaxID=190892 RepID=UPI000C5974C9|nr:4-(cytidine 5'-diphospho)-2-C-methyl-D-erythritol kinase [Idiomarina baltica]MBL74442.1 4-(cytidine 5'-diphospho)-2-C-methyl-D-erythritol kinase [Idiomarinaceae bacterium]|tara:strand:+ start:218 stop:1081 length:864 start_codon:yes stop_codon:yes gene_type:complete